MAGTEVGSLYYDLNIDDKKLKSQLDSADKSVKSFGDRASAYWGDATAASKKLLVGVAAVGVGLVAFGASSVKAYNESQTALTQLDAVLKSTGNTAGVTKDAAIALSREIQRTTSVSDETALAVENMGLTFTAIKKDIFPQTTKAAIDMATALNHGVAPSSEQAADAMKLLGKALQDPDAGLGALHRVGVNVDDLKKQFVGVNDVATKQKLILQELGREFGGSASAQAKTFSGRIAQIKNNFNDLQEQVGQVIVKALGPVADAFGRWIEKVNEAGGLLPYFNGLVNRNKTLVYALAGAIAVALIPAIISMGVSLWTALAPLLPFIAAGAALGAVIEALVNHFGGFSKLIAAVRDEFKRLYDFLEPVFGPAIKELKDTWTNDFMPALKQFWAEYGPLVLEMTKDLAIVVGIVLVGSLYAAIKVFSLLLKAISLYLDAIVAIKRYTEDSIKLVVLKSYEGGIAVSNFYMTTKAKIVGFLTEIRNTAVNIFDQIKSDVKEWTKTVENQLGQWYDNIVKKNQEFHHDWLGTIQSALNGAHDVLRQYVDGQKADFLRQITEMGDSIAQYLRGLPIQFANFFIGVKDTVVQGWQNFYSSAKTGLENTGVAIFNFGRDAYNNIAQAMSNMWNSISSFFSNLPGNIMNWLKGSVQAIKDWFTNLANDLKGHTDRAGDDIARNVHEGVRSGLSAPGRIRQIGDTLASIIGLVVVAVGFYFADAGVRLVRALFNGIMSALGSIYQAMVNGVQGALNAVWSFYGRFVDAGWGLVRAFANGISGAAGEAVNAAKGVLQKVRNYLPFSDAKVGPLSDLTLSGQRFSETFAKGIVNGAGAVTQAVTDALSVPAANLNGALAVGAVNTLVGPQTAPAVGTAGNVTTRYGDTIVNIGTVEDRSDADYILNRVDQNQRLQIRGVAPV